MDVSYKKFDSPQQITAEESLQPPPSYSFANCETSSGNNPHIQLSYPKDFAKPKDLKLWKAMKYMAVVELCLAIISIVFGSACVGTSHGPGSSYYVYESICFEGSGIWVGILCTVTGAIGIGSLTKSTGRRCLLVAYFVLSIISAVGCGILLIFSSIWLTHTSHYYKLDFFGNPGTMLALLIFNVILVMVAVIHLILSIISASLICYNWNCCGSSQPPVTIIYQQNAQTEMNIPKTI